VFGIEWTEYAVIAIVALIVIGPKELPAVLRAIGQWTTKIRRMAAEFQSQFQEALREAEMADLKKEVDTLNDAAKGFTSQFDDPLNLKEATKWEPKLDAANADGAKPDDIKPDDIKPDDIKPDDAAKPAEASSTAAPQEPAPITPASVPPQAGEGQSIHQPLHASGGTAGDEAFPVAPDHSAIEQPAPTVSPPAGTGGSSAANGRGAAEAAAASSIASPLAQPPSSERSGERGSEGGVHS
jgi:sec-independent protein translocase protein TatB